MSDQTKPLIGGYDSNGGTKTKPPRAAVFNQGATHLAEIQHAADQRRKHVEQLGEAGAKFRGRLTATRDRL
jgi:hypothetical protein